MINNIRNILNEYVFMISQSQEIIYNVSSLERSDNGSISAGVLGSDADPVKFRIVSRLY